MLTCLWRVPAPNDYHEQGAFFVIAGSASDAYDLVQAAINQEKNLGWSTADHAWMPGMAAEYFTKSRREDVEMVPGNIAFHGGCDC